MNISKLWADDDAVSPVIGVILMVAITVILAAVIATFVLGLGDQVSDTAPQASFSFDWDGSSGTEAPLNVRHGGGDTISAGNLYLRGDEGSESSADTLGDAWFVYSGGTADSEVSAGNRIEITNIGASGEVDVVWQSTEGEDSATLGSWDGPDA